MEDQSDVSSEVTDNTPVVEESASQAEPSGAEQQASAPEVKPEEKQAPFHEHPRFKELIDQNRSFKEMDAQRSQAIERMQQELYALRQQAAPKKETPVDPFLADLEKVNPAYAKSLQAIYEQAGKTTQLEQRIAQYEAQQFQKEATTHFSKLLDDNKVTDPFDRKQYERAVRAEVYERESRGQKLGLKDLEKIVGEYHSEYKKTMEERERAITAKYVTAKKADSTPKGATGGAATSSSTKKLAADDYAGQAKWLAGQIRGMKKTI